ncbi:TrpR family transcriptional regulator, trp operon repressor [Desulfocicer vacuolatum DSM 3385]|uniref:TrpR family transcriptional regulator, trp operon repressor n=1 Tax=Desulfocicer vacuolatum DSM 3385 TaxID=1121400 RepID=A0A1W2E1E5_9BACT|nr:Trp family transcriptional regulator [Desulfocicer vacuolatum]SMD03610.1 TrpR family transcriptional regulator, trp operon repressor [Desulfocicer vacuolatum DSM 3385]
MPVDKELLSAVLSVDDLEDLDALFQDLFTPGELADLSLRWKLLKDLNLGITQRKIAEKYGISLCKITRGSKILKNKNSMVLRLLKEGKDD